MSITIRVAQMTDFKDLHRLSHQLGYSPTLNELQERLEKLLSHSDYQVLVAADESGKIGGWMTLLLRQRIEDQPFLQISALISDESVRGQGYGKRLVNFAESEAKRLGFQMIALYSSRRRIEAHQFYEHLGLIKQKESLFFSKQIAKDKVAIGETSPEITTP